VIAAEWTAILVYSNMARPTQGGLWLAAQRRALGLTSDALGAAVGFEGNTIRAVESGDRPLTPRLRARAKAYFAKKLRGASQDSDSPCGSGLGRT
jgi:hypothetical protein